MHPTLTRLLLALFQGSISCNTALSLFMSVHTHTRTLCSLLSHPQPAPNHLLDDSELPSRGGFLSILGEDAPAPLTTRTSLFMLLGSCCWG